MTGERATSDALPPIERVEVLGLIGYEEARRLMALRAEQRRRGEIPDTLLLLEHPATITFGVRAGAAELRTTAGVLAEAGIDVLKTDRGGLATLHAPGQVVGYAICALTGGRRALPRFLARLERLLIEALAAWDVRACTSRRDVGLWLAGPDGAPTRRKIGSIGLAFQGGVTTHGFAVNVTNDLALFEHLVPCGLPDAEMVRLADEAAAEHRARVSAWAFMQSLRSSLRAPAWLPAPLGALQDAFNGFDAEAAVALFAADGRFEAPGRPAVVGSAALRTFFQHFYRTAVLGSFDIDAVFGRAPGEVFASYRFTWACPGDSAPRPTRGLARAATTTNGLLQSWQEFWPLSSNNEVGP